MKRTNKDQTVMEARSRRKSWLRPVLAVVNLVVALLVAGGLINIAATGVSLLPPLGPTLNPGTGVWTVASDAQTPVDETLHLPGLTNPGQVIFETNGTPHVIATTDHDMFLIIGYLHATFRLFQMDLQRREGEGLLSQVIGNNALPSDEFEDQLGLARTAQAQWAQLSPNDPARQALLAYSQGVNDVITRDEQTHQLPLMFKLLDYQPAPWTPIDSLVIQGDLTQTLSFSTAALDYAALVKSLGYQRTMQWFPIVPIDEQHPYDLSSYHGGSTIPLPASQNVSTAEASAAIALLNEFRALPANAVHHESNSNAWAVDGTKTASGMAILAGDPHLNQTLPAIWYQLDCSSPHYQFAGVSIPGLPVIIIGHNAHISWTLTNAQNQETLFYQEKISAKHPFQYFWNGAWQPMKQLKYQIPVKGSDPVDFTVNLTVHGPLMTSYGDAMSVWWAGALPSPGLDAMLGVVQASNFQQFRTALRGWYTPAQNFVYADDNGNIGIISAGYYPQVKSGQPWLPLSGTGESDVVGTIPFDNIPQLYDPPSHFIFSANQRPVNATYPYYIGTALDFDLGYRGDTIYHTLSNASHLTLTDMEKLQNDTHDYLASEIIPQLDTALSHVSLNAQQKQAAAIMQSWDFNTAVNSTASTIWQRFWHQYSYDVFYPWWQFYHCCEGAFTDDMTIQANQGSVANGVLGQDLENWTIHDPTNPAFSPPRGGKRSASQVIVQAFVETVAVLAKQLGSQPQSWIWGKVHSREFLSLAQIPSLAYGPRPSSGNDHTVNAADGGPVLGIATGGASWRFIMDWSTGKGIGVYPGGQSENPLSPWYENQIEAWWNGQYYPMLNAGLARSLPGVHTWTLQS